MLLLLTKRLRSTCRMCVADCSAASQPHNHTAYVSVCLADCDAVLLFTFAHIALTFLSVLKPSLALEQCP